MSKRETDGEALEPTTLLGELGWMLRHEKRWWIGFVLVLGVALAGFVWLTSGPNANGFMYPVF